MRLPSHTKTDLLLLEPIGFCILETLPQIGICTLVTQLNYGIHFLALLVINILCCNREESSHAQLKRHLGSLQGIFEDLWEKIYNLLELQRTGIKASFEKSKTMVQHQLKPIEFKELRGNVFVTALEMILAETKRANLLGFDKDVCGCVI